MAHRSAMILDTCGLLWLAAGHKKLSREALKEINECPAVYVSAASGFEIAIVLSLTLDVCIGSAELPFIHDDPCDRFMAAIGSPRIERQVGFAVHPMFH